MTFFTDYNKTIQSSNEEQKPLSEQYKKCSQRNICEVITINDLKLY